MKKTNQSPVGTSYHNCTITATVNELKAILGEPVHSENDGEDKVNFEWNMETNEGDVFTVYDWKEYRKISEDEKINWHIGGKSGGITIQAQAELATALTTPVKETEPRFDLQDLDEETNIPDLQKWVNDRALVGLIDEQRAGIIGYINAEHIDEITGLLNNATKAPTPTSKEGLTYKVECLDNSTAHYTHDKKEAYEVYAKFIIDFGDTIRLHEAPMPINDHDEIDWETIECYDVDENESKEGLEDRGFTPGEWEASYNSEEFPGQAAIYGCDGDTNGRVIAVLDTSDQTDMANIDLICAAPIMYDLLKWVVNEIETTPDELSDALLGMIKIKCNQLFTRINKD